jgi:hypothetical protein
MTIADIPPVLAGGAPPEERDARLETGAASLAHGGVRSVLRDERFLVGVAGALMTGGIVLIILGWLGSSRSILVAEQVPYLISGGLLGLALATIGALTFFTHWLAVLVRDNRHHHQELLQAIRADRDRQHQEILDALGAVNREPQPPVRRAVRGS